LRGFRADSFFSSRNVDDQIPANTRTEVLVLEFQAKPDAPVGTTQIAFVDAGILALCVDPPNHVGSSRFRNPIAFRAARRAMPWRMSFARFMSLDLRKSFSHNEGQCFSGRHLLPALLCDVRGITMGITKT
jgi:hypothetical protein